LHEFERIVNRMALGSAYRDILYCFSGNHSLAEVSDGTVRIMPSSDPTRVIGTIDVTPAGKLRLTVFVSALISDPSQKTEVYELAVDEPADRVVHRIDSLLKGDRVGAQRGDELIAEQCELFLRTRTPSKPVASELNVCRI
jgi:hypothetical protein